MTTHCLVPDCDEQPYPGEEFCESHLQEDDFNQLSCCDLECGNRFFTGSKTCRHGRDINESLRRVFR